MEAAEGVSVVRWLVQGVERFFESRRTGHPFVLTLPDACSCGRELHIDLTHSFSTAHYGQDRNGHPVIRFQSPEGDRQLEYRCLLYTSDAADE